jgi:hypothetical protein
MYFSLLPSSFFICEFNFKNPKNHSFCHARYDCGFFMLKFIELWNGRKLINSINPMEMPITRKLLTLKWLQWVDNKISWQEMLF